jgi:hypothetical protein
MLAAIYMKDVPKHITDWIKMKSSLTDIIKFTREVIDHIDTQEIQKEEFANLGTMEIRHDIFAKAGHDS